MANPTPNPSLQTTLQPSDYPDQRPSSSPDLSNMSLPMLNAMVKTRDPSRKPFTDRAAAFAFLVGTSP